MRTLLRCVTLCVVLVLTLCYDSDESNESIEERVIMSRNRANTFMSSPGRRQNFYQPRYKPLSERRAEVCEDYIQCRVLALRYGSQAAYRAYFGNNPVRY